MILFEMATNTRLKVCFKCERSLPRTEFYPHPRMGDGLLGKCKTCTRADSAARREAKLEEVRAYDRARARHDKAEAKRRWRWRNPEKRTANQAVNNAIAAGRLQKPAVCESCGAAGRLHGHHDDYTRPLDVRWLCPACHAAAHRELRAHDPRTHA
jgi:hypothetical protein